MSEERSILARRPGHGTAGSSCTVHVNNFLVRFKRNKLFHYNVSVTPEIHRRFKRDLINTLIEQHAPSLLKSKPVFDGDNGLFSATQIGSGAEVHLVVNLSEKTEDGEIRRKRDFKVTLREASRPDLGVLDDYLKGKIAVCPYETIQVLDLVLREAATNHKRLVPGGRSYYSEILGSRDLSGGVVAWQGFYASVRPVQNGLLALNIDMTGNAFVKEQRVVDFLSAFFKKDPRELDRELRRPDAQGDTQRVKVRRLLKDLKVETDHAKSKRRFKVATLTRQPLQELMFEKDGQQTSVVDYFKSQYNINLVFKGFPAFEMGRGDKKKYIPMELCKITRGQNFTRKVNDDQRKGLANMTCCEPKLRMDATVAAVNNLKKESSAYANQFGVEINHNWTKVPARVLPPPKVKYGNGYISPNNGAWNMINKKVVQGREIANWGILSFSSYVRDQDLVRIVQELAKSCNSYGLGMKEKTAFPPMQITAPQGVESTIRNIVKKLASMNTKLQLLVCIIGNAENKAFYVAIKRLCELELGIVTQCLKDDKVKKCDPRYLANVILKINVKLGGVNSVIAPEDQRKCRLISESPTLIIGADVSHPKDEAGFSMAAVVASMDWPGFAQYATIVKSQPSRKEMLDGLFWENVDEQGHKETGGIFKEMLMAFHHKTQFVPHRIVYYRDGVSEGQFDAVLRSEYESLKRACDALGWCEGGSSVEPAQKRFKAPEKGPKITFIVVQKRHHTCFFPENARNPKENVRPGTIVDKTVCHPINFDFYLCSHQGIKGTSRPTHYHVLKDENGFSADEIQQFTHDQCYLYSRCTRAVSYVPACYYAHLAAQRAQTWVDPDGSSGYGGGSTTQGGGSAEGAPGSEGGSTAAGTSAGAAGRRGRRHRDANAPVRPLPPLHEDIKNSMFYI